ncbi:probable cationic amino acid transporter [Uranotaenia lowii]|uniref:probable cationic amino acid transporter n=1 Tax=Uranotaenia lowii TaxID=190385 RepID=UPI002478BBA9|nr:probable cationic amino acid transporter [Uranotaenia lowii]
MKFSFPLPGGGTGLTLFSKLVRTKDLRKLQGEDPKSTKPKLTKCLTTLDLTSLGVGSCCGTGMYLVAGMVARNIAGPGVILSFIIAAVASIFSVEQPYGNALIFVNRQCTILHFVVFLVQLHKPNITTDNYLASSRVFTGAATCFYAFIGFDIIATTGEEAHNPQKSIPKAIVGSLVIVLFVYVTSSLVLTLTVPYDHIDPGSALVQMWSYVGAPKCQALVAFGATAGLSVAMFGSMFPMPRVIYAMAQDGLVFRMLSQLWARTGVPGIATIGSGIAAALVALTVRLEVLVEMMSIGTLLAYTLVSTCVLILRYQPHTTTLVDLLPAQLRTPQPPSTPDPTTQQRIKVKKITRGSPDSDDSFCDDSPDGFMGRDDQFLVSDKSENKFYGAVHGAPQGGSNPFTLWGFGYIGRKIQQYSYLCPGLFPWVNPGPATHESGMFVTKMVGLMYACIFFLDLFMAIGITGTFFSLIYTALVFGIFAILLVISRQPQNRYALPFLTPGLPFIPTIAITVNIYLIFKLSILTLVRFTVWMSLGLIMYFYYGITHSSLENPNEEFELTVDSNGAAATGSGQGGGASQPTPNLKVPSHRDQTAVWDRHGYENRMATNDDGELQWSGATNSWNPSDAWGDTTIYDPPRQQQQQQQSSGPRPGSTNIFQPPPPTTKPAATSQQRPEVKKDGFGLFYQETSSFPTWDD